MKNKHVKFLLVSLTMLGMVTGCNKSETSGSVIGDNEEWSGNWTKPDWNPDDDPVIKHECTMKCFTCGKCLDMSCEEEACKEKCYDLTGRTKYTYSAANRKVKLVPGTRGDIVRVPNDTDGGYVDNFNTNKGSEIIYSIVSSEDVTACLGATISRMFDPVSITNTVELYVNNEQVISRAYVPGNTAFSQWFDWTDYYVGCISLKKGENEIKIVNPRDDSQQFNFKSLSIISSTKIELGNASGYEEHPCTHKDADGYCTDYTSNYEECLHKREDGWKKTNLYGKDDKVLKFHNSDDNIWNDAPNEQCIGYIDSVNNGQTIIWSFTSTEETYVRLAIEHSLNKPGLRFDDVWDMTFDGEVFFTEGATSTQMGGYADYTFSTIAYLKAKLGKNTFKMVHASTQGYNLRSLDIYYASGNIEIAQAER